MIAAKLVKSYYCGLAILCVFLSGCGTEHPSISFAESDTIEQERVTSAVIPTNDPSGIERIFTNANVVVWVPNRANDIGDGHTSFIQIDETTPAGAFVKDFKIEFEILINEGERELRQLSKWGASDWFFQEHPEISIAEAHYGKQIRKDIWNPEKTRRLLIHAKVKRSATFENDIKTAVKMVESVKLIPK